jgi:uncharacterized protein YbaR (Trm112 family)
MRLSSELLRILVCPVTKGKLIYDQISQELISLNAGLSYPIIEGIPIMLVEEAREISPTRLKKISDSQQNSLEIVKN